MPTLAELLSYLVQPRGGPMIPALAKSPSNATGGSIPGVAPPKGEPLSSPSEMMAALTAMGNAQYENRLREAQAEQARQAASLFKSAVELGGQGPTYTTGGAGVSSPAAPMAWGSLGQSAPVQRPPLAPGVGGAFRSRGDEWVAENLPVGAIRNGPAPNAAALPWKDYLSVPGNAGDIGPGAPSDGGTPLTLNIPPPRGLAPNAPGLQENGLPRLDAASLARAQRMENIYGILGKKMPTWAEEGVKMAPGGSMSPEYKGAIATTEAWAKVAPELFTQTQLKQLQAGLDLSLKEKQAMLDRASEAQKQRLAASLDVVPTTVKMPDGSFETRQITRGELAGRVAPQSAGGAGAGVTAVPQTLAGGAVIAGLPAGAGSTSEGYRLVAPPGGGATRQERIPGSPIAQAGETAQGERQQAADIMKQDIARTLKLSQNEEGLLGSTGVQGALLRGVPGTAAYNLRLMLDSVKANTAFDRITQMRNSSQSGAALGAVSDRDLALLQATMGSLEQSQSKDQFEFTLKRLHNIAQDVINGTPADLENAVQKGTLSRAQFDQAIARREKDRYSEGRQIDADTMANARAAVATKGRDAVIEHLRKNGFDTSKF